MAIVKNIPFTIFAICILFECIQISAASNFTLNQYVGIWYQVGLLLPVEPIDGIICEWFVTTRNNKCHGCFDETYGKSSDRKNTTRDYGSGLIINSEVHVSYPTLGRMLQVFTATTYKNRREVILCAKNNRENCKALSRTTTISKETKAAFGKLAMDADLFAVYIRAASC